MFTTATRWWYNCHLPQRMSDTFIYCLTDPRDKENHRKAIVAAFNTPKEKLRRSEQMKKTRAKMKEKMNVQE